MALYKVKLRDKIYVITSSWNLRNFHDCFDENIIPRVNFVQIFILWQNWNFPFMTSRNFQSCLCVFEK